MCREKFAMSCAVIVPIGSTPLLRGEVGRSHHTGLLPGIIPASAGRSQTQSSRRSATKDHPRVCGEKNTKEEGAIDPQGSPPHPQGKVGCCVSHSRIVRITPAPAGRRTHPSPGTSASQDHPRMCGEKNRFRSDSEPVLGSPPLLRGEVVFVPIAVLYHRIIPAPAGKSRI